MRRSPIVSSESMGLSLCQCSLQIPSGHPSLYLCVYVPMVQTSWPAEPARVIRVVSAQSDQPPSVGGSDSLGFSDPVYVCVCMTVSQASGAAEPICVIRVNGAQSLTMFTQVQSGQPGLLLCVCVCPLFKPPSQRSLHKSSESSALSPSH